MSRDRESVADPVEFIKDPELKARREAENGVRQFRRATQIIRDNLPNDDDAFRLKQSIILQLHREALDGIHPLAGTYRNSRIFITNSHHLPPQAVDIPDHVSDMCAYVNSHWSEKNACHLSSYVLWKLNWIHPFADGNGRTARIVSYLILNIKLKSLLPGSPTIPDLMASDKSPYYSELEKADREWLRGVLDISGMERQMENLLAQQLLNATREAGL